MSRTDVRRRLARLDGPTRAPVHRAGPALPGRPASVRPHDEGFVAGLEALAFGVVVFVVGTLVLVNGWAVVDAKFATNGAAREAVRAVVETPGEGARTDMQLQAIALRAAQDASAAHGYTAGVVAITPRTVSGTLSQARCESVRIEASVRVRATILPGLGGPGLITVASVHEEVIDPFRTGLAARDGLDRTTGNPCGF